MCLDFLSNFVSLESFVVCVSFRIVATNKTIEVSTLFGRYSQRRLDVLYVHSLSIIARFAFSLFKTKTLPKPRLSTMLEFVLLSNVCRFRRSLFVFGMKPQKAHEHSIRIVARQCSSIDT